MGGSGANAITWSGDVIPLMRERDVVLHCDFPLVDTGLGFGDECVLGADQVDL
jgi:hypothetical protein